MSDGDHFSGKGDPPTRAERQMQEAIRRQNEERQYVEDLKAKLEDITQKARVLASRNMDLETEVNTWKRAAERFQQLAKSHEREKALLKAKVALLQEQKDLLQKRNDLVEEQKEIITCTKCGKQPRLPTCYSCTNHGDIT